MQKTVLNLEEIKLMGPKVRTIIATNCIPKITHLGKFFPVYNDILANEGL